jgi:polysaccharide pyruvyl transferase WcaK-like protein
MIHYVFASRSNIGDWLSSQGIQSLLGNRPGKEYLCDEPFVPETIKQLHLASENDLIVIGGGGLFMDYFTPFWEGFLPIAERIPFGIWGVGFCDLKHANSRVAGQLLSSIIARSQFCYVRDELTRTYLNEANLPPSVECPSINIIGAVEPGKGLLHVSHYGDVGPEVYLAMHEAGMEFSRSTGRQYVEADNEIPSGVPKQQGLSDLLSRYASADIILSSRLHGCIVGLAMGRKVIAVSADRKVDAFMTSVGLQDWLCDVTEVSRLPELLSAIDDQPSVAEFLASIREKNRGIAEQVSSVIERLENQNVQSTPAGTSLSGGSL